MGGQGGSSSCFVDATTRGMRVAGVAGVLVALAKRACSAAGSSGCCFACVPRDVWLSLFAHSFFVVSCHFMPHAGMLERSRPSALEIYLGCCTQAKQHAANRRSRRIHGCACVKAGAESSVSYLLACWSCNCSPLKAPDRLFSGLLVCVSGCGVTELPRF